MFVPSRIRLTVFLAFTLLVLVIGGRTHAASYEVTLQTPKLESVAASLSLPGGTAEVLVNVAYDAAGAAELNATIDGMPAQCTGQVAAKTGRAAYHFTLREPANSGAVVVLTGSSTSYTARASYTGAKGRLRDALVPVTVDVLSSVNASVAISPIIGSRNAISGEGGIETGFATNAPSPGTVRGKVSASGLFWIVRHGTRTARFHGRRVGDAFVGTLRIVAKPAAETWHDFSIPASDFPLAGGVAVFRGTLVFVGEEGPAAPNNATVTVRSDLDGDGLIAGKESVRGVSDENGRYEVKFEVKNNRPVQFEVHQADFGDILASYPSVSPGAVVTKNAVAESLDSLIVTQGTAASPAEDVRFRDLPQNIAALSARSFNPSLAAAQFPGAFAEAPGSLLVPSVFAAITAQDGLGRAVTNIGADVTLSLMIPKESWAGLRDEVPGNGRIDVPCYFYDQELGKWTRNISPGFLEDRARTLLSESELGLIRTGTFAGELFAATAISRIGYWSVSWPVLSNAVLHGMVVDTNGFLVSGATVEVSGWTYPGRSMPVVTAEDGQFCVETLRSESTNEDLDRDGVNNETHQVQFTVRWRTNVFAFGPFHCPSNPAVCGGGGGLMVGPLTLSDAQQLKPNECTVAGQVVYSGRAVGEEPQLNPGDGVPGAFVSVVDPDALDLSPCSGCISAVADTNGLFSITAPVMSGAGLHVSSRSLAGGAIGTYRARANFTNCASAPATIAADYVNFGFFVCQIYDNQAVIGALTIMDSVVDVYIAADHIAVGQLPDTEVPTQAGPWATVPLTSGDMSGPADGTISFTVTRLNPVGGTWQRSSPSGNSNGGWQQVLVGP